MKKPLSETSTMRIYREHNCVSDHKGSVGFFVGEGEYIELAQIENKRREQGWTFGQVDDSTLVSALKENIHRPIVVNGGSAGNCVALMVKSALQAGANSVTVPLGEIIERRINTPDFDSQMRINANALILGLRIGGIYDLKDPRLRVEPEEIWSQECNQFNQRNSESSSYLRSPGEK